MLGRVLILFENIALQKNWGWTNFDEKEKSWTMKNAGNIITEIENFQKKLPKLFMDQIEIFPKWKLKKLGNFINVKCTSSFTHIISYPTFHF